ncbi:MAG: hypothetical protein QOJ02_208 [Acidobacteriota bacterium]|jgi:hypothetical protein|nr:hypothetical protein [Acidobacteriota bacterium]
MYGLLCPGNLSAVFFEFFALLLYTLVPVVVSACFAGTLANLIMEALAARKHGRKEERQ